MPGKPYSNYLRVGWNAFEFVLDFGDHHEGGAEAASVAMIVTSPAYAKAFTKTLQDSIDSYERQFGTIPERLE